VSNGRAVNGGKGGDAALVSSDLRQRLIHAIKNIFKMAISRYAQLSIVDPFLQHHCGMEVHKKLINYCNSLILGSLHLWVKIVQTDSEAEKIGIYGTLPQIIHRVIHSFCG